MASPEVDPVYEFDAPRGYDFSAAHNSDDEQRYIEEWFHRKEREYHSRSSQVTLPSSAKRRAFKKFVENRNDKNEDKRYAPIQPSQKSLYTSTQAQQAITDKENNPNQVPPPPKTKVTVHTALKPRLTVPRSPKLATARRLQSKYSVLPDQPQLVSKPDPKPVRKQPPRVVKALQPRLPTQPIQQKPKTQPTKPSQAKTQPKPKTQPFKPASKPPSRPRTQTKEFNFRTEKRKRNAENQPVPSKDIQKAPSTASSVSSNNSNNRGNQNNNNNNNNNNRSHNNLPPKKTKKPAQPQNNKRKFEDVPEKNPVKKQRVRDVIPPPEEKPAPFKANKVNESLLHGPPRGVPMLPPMQLTIPQSPVLQTKVRSQFKTERKSATGAAVETSQPQSLPKSLMKPNAKRRELIEPVPFKLQADTRKKRKLEDDVVTHADKKVKAQN